MLSYSVCMNCFIRKHSSSNINFMRMFIVSTYIYTMSIPLEGINTHFRILTKTYSDSQRKLKHLWSTYVAKCIYACIYMCGQVRQRVLHLYYIMATQINFYWSIFSLYRITTMQKLILLSSNLYILQLTPKLSCVPWNLHNKFSCNLACT